MHQDKETVKVDNTGSYHEVRVNGVGTHKQISKQRSCHNITIAQKHKMTRKKIKDNEGEGEDASVKR